MTVSDELIYQLGLTIRTRIENLPLFELPSWPNMATSTNFGNDELLAYGSGIGRMRGEWREIKVQGGSLRIEFGGFYTGSRGVLVVLDSHGVS